jgi:hypothetical protein
MEHRPIQNHWLHEDSILKSKKEMNRDEKGALI